MYVFEFIQKVHLNIQIFADYVHFNSGIFNNNQAEPRETIKVCIYYVFTGFLIFWSCRSRTDTMHNQNNWAKFSIGHFKFPPHMFL